MHNRHWFKRKVHAKMFWWGEKKTKEFKDEEEVPLFLSEFYNSDEKHRLTIL